MMVTFISQCQKNALKRTRRVLDSFADRIGSNAWQSVITQDGLAAVKKLLRKTASKNTAVSCHWIRSRSRSDLMWVVGNKSKFNHGGFVPVNSTRVNRPYNDEKADWHYLPVIQSLAALAALLHDWGKASERFQEKLQPEYKGKGGDAIRHEWVSCLLLKALIVSAGYSDLAGNSDSDEVWLTKLAEGNINEEQLKNTEFKAINRPLKGLPPTAQLLAWLILTHHRLPLLKQSRKEIQCTWKGEPAEDLDTLFQYIIQSWGYENTIAEDTLNACLHFPNGLISNSKKWIKEVKRWANKLLGQQDKIQKIIEDGSYRLVLHHARLCLMLGDHYFSSLDKEQSGQWENTTGLIANTQKDPRSKKAKNIPKQALDQHLVGVYKSARNNANHLPLFESHAPRSDDVALLKKKSPGDYDWQDKAVKEIQKYFTQAKQKRQGFFAVNMASTGCGKTFANAKVMRILSEDNNSLRYILALGLRTLTLQTGDEYKERIFQKTNTDDLAVLIGSKAIAELHEQDKLKGDEVPWYQQHGSESEDTLLGANEDIIGDCEIPEEGLATVLKREKDKVFLYAPVLVCTIDHIMAATETTRGGRYILPCLRLMSSDLVIDEIDDFTGSDLIAIGRLVHLAGMLGRKVMISSATIPPALAEGYFHAYRKGWRMYCKTRNASQIVACAWIDEFRTLVSSNQMHHCAEANALYAEQHQHFIAKRVNVLKQQVARRKADIIPCGHLLAKQIHNYRKSGTDEVESKQQQYFSIIAEAAINKHQQHHSIDQQTELQVSFGLIRTANIQPCIALTLFLLNYDWPKEIEIRTMAYHSRQVLLLRHEQEKHLDEVLKRKEKEGETPKAFKNAVIRHHLDEIHATQSTVKHVMFILVATPVEEVGRDHDFDWAIVEPSSYRSIIQLAGRVRRHRQGEVSMPNIGLLQYNWKTIKNGEKKDACYFVKPGYEMNEKIFFNGKSRKAICPDHSLSSLLNNEMIAKGLDAIPRIQLDVKKTPKFAKLEHAVTAHWLTNYNQAGPESLQGYLKQHWYLTGFPQKLQPFRQSEATVSLFLMVNEEGERLFAIKDDQGHVVRDDVYGDPVDQSKSYGIEWLELSDKQHKRLWLYRDYQQMLYEKADKNAISIYTVALRYGELSFPASDSSLIKYRYNDQLGLLKI